MNEDFRSRITAYDNGDPRNQHFREYRLSQYSYAPTRERTYYNENWWDTWSNLMQGSHRTSISSLNDDNREDEKEIEILLEASKLRLDTEDIDSYIDFVVEKLLEAVRSGDVQAMDYWRKEAQEAKKQKARQLDIIQQADDIVRRDKQSFTLLNGHNPILEAIGEIADYITTGAAGGATIGAPFGGPVGSAVGGILGAIGGALYGGYDYFASGRNNIDRSAYEEPLNEDKRVNYANSIKTRESYKLFRLKQIEDELADLLYWQTEYPVSDYYKMMEESGVGNYMYYNLPGIIGSSFSDTKDMGQLAIGSYGLHKLAKIVPKGKWAIRTAAFIEALRNGWQASLNENHAEADESATKKTLQEIKKNKALSEEMVNNARTVAKSLYGISETDAKQLIDEETAFTMYNSNIGGLNPRNLANSYSYYKNARRLGDSGADQQFWRDMTATAGGDVLEAALMVTPYSAIAGKSKMFGRAIAGAALGSTVAEFSGMGMPGAVLGGIAGGIAALVPFARKLWRNTMTRVLAIEDRLLPSLEQLVMLGKIGRSVGAFGATSLAEAAEEGTQYLNALDAEKIRQAADYDLNLSEVTNLFANDLKKRGQVFKAVLSQLGLADSPYLNDQEFWSNWKGGLFLGGLMTGAITSLREAAGAKKAYQAAKYVLDEVLSSAVANRMESLDAILKGVAFAKHGRGGHAEDIIEAITKAQEQNRYRENTPFSNEDFESIKRRAATIATLADSRAMLNRLKRLGYEPDSEEANYALSVYTYILELLENSAKEQLLTTSPQILLALNDPNFLTALDQIAGPEVLNDDGIDGSQFKVREMQEDGSVKEYEISNRERHRRLHQKAAELLAVTQLLKDLKGVTDFKQWAKDHGMAFNSNLAERSIAELKRYRDLLKLQVEYYSESKYTLDSTYDQQIDYLKSYVLDYANSGLKLIDAYRDQTLRTLNSNIYKNILNALGLSKSAHIDIENREEAGKISRNMTKMFMDNVQKNKEFQEIIDYTIKSSNDNYSEQQRPGLEEEVKLQLNDIDYEHMDVDDIVSSLETNALFKALPYENLLHFVTEKENDALDNADRYHRKLFGNKKFNYWMNLANKWEDVYLNLFNKELQTADNSEDTQENEAFSSSIDVDISNVQPVKVTVATEKQQSPGLELEDDVDKSEEAVQSGVDESPAESESPIDPTEPAQNDENKTDESPAESDSESAIIYEELPSDLDITNIVETTQSDSILNLLAGKESAPKKILPGWYVTSDGKIVPSERMFMANPVEAKKGSHLSEIYKKTAAEIRLALYNYVNAKGQSEDEKLKTISLYVSRILYIRGSEIYDSSIINPISKAILNGDQNAIKLVVMYANKRTWCSFYVNEYFRDAFNKILNGIPVQRPDYIDSDVFKEFLSKVIQYKRVMESRYGWKFITDYVPGVTVVEGQLVVAEPDVVAVDGSGNIHIANIHTMRNDDYYKWGNKPINMENTKDTFSILEERSAYADIQIKSFLEKPGVIISSSVLIPVVVDDYKAVHRLYLGKLIPVDPSEEAVIKYKDLEDLLEELKYLLTLANEKALDTAKSVNDSIKHIKNFRREHRTSGYRFKKDDVFEFTPDAEPTTVAEAYAQINRANKFINRALKFLSDHISKELAEIQKTEQEESRNNKKANIAKDIERINQMADESKTGGVLVDIKDADDILNNKDLIQNGKVKMHLVTTPESKYIACELEYKENTYKIHLRRPKKYGGNLGSQLFPNYSEKMLAIALLLSENPDVVITVDLKRSYITYAEKPKGSTPTSLTDKDSIITQEDINNLGVQLDDGKTVSIGFYDKKTGLIQTGRQDDTAALGQAPDGDWWLNQLFMVIKQRHAEDKFQERKVSIPIIKSAFNAKLANFIAQCYKVIAETNHIAEEDGQKRRTIANQMLHLFIGQRVVYKKGEPELPNVVYTNGDSVRLNGTEYFILDKNQFSEFAKELRKCKIMPRWDTFNSKFKNLADSSFSVLYDHFSTFSTDFNIQIDGVDSGLKISKDSFENDTLCQWLAKNNFFATNWFVQNEASFSLHNLTVGTKIEQQVKGELNAPANPLPDKKDDIEEFTLEELEKQGYVIVEDDEDDDEDADYSSRIDRSNIVEYNQIRNLQDGKEAIDLIGTLYKRLARLLRSAAKTVGMPKIEFVVLDEQGEWKEINGVERQKKGTATANADGTWTITFWQGNPNPIKTLAHEMVHIFTLGAIEKNTNFVRAAKIFYSTLKETLSKDELSLYGFKNFKEFVAEFFTNPEMIDLLKTKDPVSSKVFKDIETVAGRKPKNMLQSFISFISKAWQKYILRRSPNSYNQIYSVMRDLLEDSSAYGKTESFDMYDGISIQDIMGNVINDIKEKLSINKKGYSYKNHITQKTIHLDNCSSPSELRAAVDGIMTLWIRHEDITPLGKNIDKLKFSTSDLQRRLAEDGDFEQWWHDTLEESDIPLVKELAQKTQSDTSYEKEVKRTVRVNGKLVKVKKKETFYEVKLEKWDAAAPIIEEFLADKRLETRKKAEYRRDDEEISLREEGRNEFDELLTYSEQINPLERASREVKWLFSTVPASKPNELGMEVFMPFRDVFGKVLYYTSRCHSFLDVVTEFAKRSITGPDKEMFAYLHLTLVNMNASKWRPADDVKNKKVVLKSNNTTNELGNVFDANIESSLIKVMRTIRQQENDFVWATAWDEVDKDGEKSKKIEIRTTLYQKGVVMAISNWRDQLATGASGVLKYDTSSEVYKYQKGKEGLFYKIYRDLFVGKESFIYAYNKSKELDPEDIVLHWNYFEKEGVLFSDLTADDVKTYLHNALLELGVDVRQEVLQEWINQVMDNNPSISTEMDALYAIFADQFSQHRPSNFFSRLAVDGDITSDVLIDAFNSGFIKELANMQNEYDLRTQNLMTVASHNNQYYIVSESNYINDIAKVLTKLDQEDSYIKMLQEDSFAQGSVVSEALLNGEKLDIHVATFVGMKTNNIGDQGRDYFEIGLDEDIISKFELLHEGYMLSPTQSNKKTYHVLKGIPLVGMLIGKRTNTYCYGANLKLGEINIKDNKILDRFIRYFESEKNAVEKAILAYEDGFYKKNPGKKIVNYSDKNGMRFSSFNSIPLANGNTLYLNAVGNTPRQNLSNAHTYFFDKTKSELREIMSRILLQRAKEDLNKAIEVGLIKLNEDGLYENVGLDGRTILEMSENIGKSILGNDFKLKKYEEKNTHNRLYGPNSKMCISLAIQLYVLDCSIKHLMSMQEYQRLFSGSKSFYKWKSNSTHVIDISVDYTKRRGGDISTGGVNIDDIDPLDGMEELGTYRVMEIEDPLIESTTLGATALTESFELSEFASIASVIKSGKDSSTMDLTNLHLPENLYEDKEEAENIVRLRYGEDFVKIVKQKAKSDAMQYFKENKDDEAPVNVADGATYITDKMCEKLLREEGKWDDDMKYAFEVLRGKHGASVLSEKGLKLYKSILNVIIGTQKYTATGFRKSDDGQGGTLMTPYYNKTALFPIFDQIAYGKMHDILAMMRVNNVDMIMLTSAVKVGGQGAITFEEFISGRNNSDHAYIQEMRFLRKQLNTDPNEREEMNFGTQTIKNALSNLRMNDDYVDPFTGKKVKGKELYRTIMHAYNVLADIGFEEVMHRFCKTRPDGNPDYINNIPAIVNDKGEVVLLTPEIGHASIPNIDEEKLSIFLHEELMARDCNDNMLDAIAYDKDTDRLAAPLSAISGSGWIDSILASFINKTIIDTRSPGSAYILRSVFAMEGDGLKTINGGKELKLINEDGSMDAVISIDFFKDIIPGYDNMTFEQARQWLIDHKLIGEHAKTYTISYRIPTQAQSSINPLKFVDVVPIIRDSIILPKEFTKLTGSDFDIDKLYLSRLFINPDTINNEDRMFTFVNKNTDNVNEKLDILRKGYTNALFKLYITLLMDSHSHKTKWRPIDADTKLWKDVYDDLYSQEWTPVQSLSLDTIAYQTQQKNNFVTGKIGIGPYALNNNNHIYTMLYGISLNPKSMLHNVGEERLDMGTLCRSVDIYGNSILAWLSGGINAHVDIASDPFVTKLNINEYTYNISNFLLRAGFGRNALWFLNLPVIKELSRRMNAVNGQYLKATNKDLFDAREEILSTYKQQLLDAIPQDIKDQKVEINEKFDSKFKLLLGRDLTVNDILFNKYSVYNAINKADPELLKEWIKEWPPLAREVIDPKLVTKAAFDKVCDDLTNKGFLDDMVQKDKERSILYRMAKNKKSSSTEITKKAKTNLLSYPEIYNYIAVTVFDQINQKEAKTTSDLTKYTKIDTKKQGSTAAALIDFLHQYNKFVNRLFGERPDITGDVEGFFGILDPTDLLGFDTSLNLSNDNLTGQQESNLLLGGQTLDFPDVLQSGYVLNRSINPYHSFIERKTKKAINTLLSVIRNDSVEGTYGFLVIWERIKSDYGKGSLTDDAQSKLRSSILGAIKNMWVHNAMNAHGIDPVTLFRDTDSTKSLAHELVSLKTKRIVDVNEKGRKRIMSVREKFKNNALLNILYDAHTKNDYLESDKLIEILDFIMVHIPFTDDTKKANVYIKAWKELYDDEITKDFAVKLMFYSLLTSNDSGGNNLFKYVPFQMLKDYGLFDAERSVIQMLADPSLLLGKTSNGVRLRTEDMLEDTIEYVESILAEDWYFSAPFKIQTKKQRINSTTGAKEWYDSKEYTSFCNCFNNTIVNKNNSDSGIPYVFIPAKINKGAVYRSDTICDRYGNVINRSYIRVLNPIANFENQLKYLNYKRIGEINLQGKIYPIYKLVNNPLYTLGLYKVYNYGNKIDISSSLAVSNMSKSIYSLSLSVKDLDDLISEAVKDVKNNPKDSDNIAEVLRPLYDIDDFILKQREQLQYEFRIYNIRTNILSKYDDYEYLVLYKNKNEKSGRELMAADLLFVIDSEEFTLEEKSIASDMLSNIKLWNSYREQARLENKQPNTNNDPRVYKMHSGGAWGADTDWSNVGILYGMSDNINDSNHFAHYYYGKLTPNGNTPISKADYEDGINHVLTANDVLHREGASKYYNLLGRNWVQVKNSDAIFAVGELRYGQVNGGTGWAVQMAIDAGKPVHVFDLNTEKWYVYDTDQSAFIAESTPKLTKNFAGIGTRSIDPNIEEKTNDKVKYVGDEKRQAALDAMDAVFRNTFGDPKPQPKNPAEFNGKNNPQENFNGPKESLEVLESPNTILSNKELLKLKPYTGSDTHPRIAVASEHADPAFFSQLIVGLFDEGKPLTVKQMKTVKTGKKTADGKDIWERKEVDITYTAEDFDALYIITKHDGLPLKKILQTKIPKLIHFSVTGMGGTNWEPGVMKYQDMLKCIKDFMKMDLDPEMVTMRIDPIIPGITPFEVIEDIVKKSAAMGIKTIKFSVMDWYRSTAPEVVKNTGYDYSKYYEPELDDKGEPKTYWWCPKDKDGKPIPGSDGKPQWEKYIVYKPNAKVEEQKKISDFMLSLKDKYGVTLQSCAEPLILEGIEKVGCLSVPAINNMLGTHIEDRGVDNNKQRALCTCYGGKTDLMSYDQNCASVCWYCYAHHQGDKILNYYNPDGTLKDNAWTRTGYEEEPETSNLYLEDGKPIVMYRGYALTEDREANDINETIGHTAVDYADNLKGSIYFTSSEEEAWEYAKTRTDKSDEEFINDKGEKVIQRNRHYTGDYAKVSSYNFSANAKVEHYKDINDFRQNGQNSTADVIILDQGTMWKGNAEYIVTNKKVLIKSNVTKTVFSQKLSEVIKTHNGYWTRSEAENNPRTLYVFTDNMDRDSGSNLIPEDSWYGKKYGPDPMHYPTSTAAVVRGLDNARPISTMHFFYKTHGYSHPAYDKSSKALWHDSDVEEFRKVVRSELQDIVEAFNSGKYDSIMFPDGDGLFNTNLSQISNERTPELYKALSDLLKEYGFDKLIPKEPEIQLSVDPESWSKKEGWSVDYFNKNVIPRINEAWLMEYEVVSHAMNRETPTAGPSSYTYKDGTRVETPFLLTVEQANALEKIEEFINDRDQNVLTVSGYAGTGKTSVMEIVAQRHKGDWKHSVIFTASTNKASSVLGSKVKKKGFSSSTLDKYFGLGLKLKKNNVYYDARQTETSQGEFKGNSGDIVIIDEASMINREKYNILVQTAREENLKIIFLGDIAQLPPVGETISPVFENNENLIQLTEVKRTGDNAILKEATNLRLQNGDFSYVSSFNTKGEGVAFTSSKLEVYDIIYEYAKHLKEDPNFVKIVAGTNKAVEDYNTKVREILGYNTPIPQEGENVMGYDNWGRIYDPITRKSSYKVVNSEDYIVKEVGKTSTKKINLSGNEYDLDGELVDIKYTPITLKDPSGKQVTVPFVLYSENAESLVKIANATQALKIAASSAKGKAKRDILEALNYLGREIMCDRDVVDQRGNTILKKGLDFGYAITSHKSQGSTYKHVVIDKNDMDGAFGNDRATAQRMYYTAVSRATTTATIYTRNTKVEGNPITNPVGKDANTPKMEISMYFQYDGKQRQDVMSNSTFDAILSGERTATTRYESDYNKYPGTWDKLMLLKTGDIITMRDSKENNADSRRINVRITVPLHKLASDTGTTDVNIPNIINVSSYGEYANLSNFALRPFDTKFSNKFGSIQVKSIEHAFLLSKAGFAYSKGDITIQQLTQIYDEMSKLTEGKDFKQAGGRIPMSLKTLDEWKAPLPGKFILYKGKQYPMTLSDQVLYTLMKKSFESSEEALKQLLATGNAEFTHNYNNGKPIEPNDPDRFGRLLSKVRSDIREQKQTENNCS